MNSGPIDGKKKSDSLGTETFDNIKFSTVICYDADFNNVTAKAADMGAQLILDPSNDWREIRHHHATVVIRAVENRVAVVKAESSMDAVIVDPFRQNPGRRHRQGCDSIRRSSDIDAAQTKLDAAELALLDLYRRIRGVSWTRYLHPSQAA
jgi:hypothetical protein